MGSLWLTAKAFSRKLAVKKYLALCALAAALASCVGHEDEFARSLAVKGFADLILMNGKIVTVDENFSIKEAVAVTDGKIAAVGGDGEMRRWTGPRTQVINLNGRTVIPGVCMSTRKYEMPLCFGASGSVRASRIIQSAKCA